MGRLCPGLDHHSRAAGNRNDQGPLYRVQFHPRVEAPLGNTKIWKDGRSRRQLSCIVCGPIDDGNDLEILRYLQEHHGAICPGKSRNSSAPLLDALSGWNDPQTPSNGQKRSSKATEGPRLNGWVLLVYGALKAAPSSFFGPRRGLRGLKLGARVKRLANPAFQGVDRPSACYEPDQLNGLDLRPALRFVSHRSQPVDVRRLRVALEEVWKTGYDHPGHGAEPVQPWFVQLRNTDPMQASSSQAQPFIRIYELISILGDDCIKISSCQTFEELYVLNAS